MAIALDQPRVVSRSARAVRVRRWIGVTLTWVALIAALIFFLGPFFWILTTSVKANEDYFAYPPVWVPGQRGQAQAPPWGLAAPCWRRQPSWRQRQLQRRSLRPLLFSQTRPRDRRTCARRLHSSMVSSACR